jgi:hypothetical protein
MLVAATRRGWVHATQDFPGMAYPTYFDDFFFFGMNNK